METYSYHFTDKEIVEILEILFKTKTETKQEGEAKLRITYMLTKGIGGCDVK